MSTLFEKIIAREIPATIEYEDSEIIAIRDIAPSASLHLLIIPKQAIPGVNNLTAEHEALIGRIYLVAQQLAAKFGVSESGYRLVTNTNADAGQTVFHLHVHLLGGEPLGRMNSTPAHQHTSTLRESGLLILFAIGLAIGFNMMNPRSITWVKPEFERVVATDDDLGITDRSTDRITDTITERITHTETSSNPSKNTSSNPSSNPSSDPSSDPSSNPSSDPSSTSSPTFAAQPGVVKEITKAQFIKLMKQPHFLIDARTAESYGKGHIGSAVNYYGGEAQMHIPDMLANVPRDRVILIYCDGGECELSHHIADVLKQFQYGPMYIFTGGWAEWSAGQ